MSTTLAFYVVFQSITDADADDIVFEFPFSSSSLSPSACYYRLQDRVVVTVLDVCESLSDESTEYSHYPRDYFANALTMKKIEIIDLENFCGRSYRVFMTEMKSMKSPKYLTSLSPLSSLDVDDMTDEEYELHEQIHYQQRQQMKICLENTRKF